MKRCPALALTALLLTAAPALAGGGPAPADDALAAANRALQGRQANVLLAGGETFRGVREVFLGPESTTWEADGRIHEVPTADVQRIALTKRSRVRTWTRRGLIAGALVGAVGVGYSERDGLFVESPDAGEIAAGAAAGAAVGAGAAALAGEKVVFEAP